MSLIHQKFHGAKQFEIFFKDSNGSINEMLPFDFDTIWLDLMSD